MWQVNYVLDDVKMNGKKKSIFETLYTVDVSEKIKEKNGLNYLPWSSAWAETKKVYPDATFDVVPQIMDSYGNTRPWHDDGKTGWVEISVTIEGETINESLPIMDFKNKSIPAENITSTDANKAMKRCLVKCLALFGMATFVFEGEDLPEEATKINNLKTEIKELVVKKCSTEKGKARVAELCKAAEKEANPLTDDADITGNYANIEEIDILEKLKKQLLAVRIK